MREAAASDSLGVSGKVDVSSSILKDRDANGSYDHTHAFALSLELGAIAFYRLEWPLSARVRIAISPMSEPWERIACCRLWLQDCAYALEPRTPPADLQSLSHPDENDVSVEVCISLFNASSSLCQRGTDHAEEPQSKPFPFHAAVALDVVCQRAVSGRR
jgi:hypothetical protein